MLLAAWDARGMDKRSRGWLFSHCARGALADFDPPSWRSQRWANLLVEPQEGLTLEIFDETVDDDNELPATAEAFGTAIVAGCRHRLLSCREASPRAMRDGFTEHADLRIQLDALSSADMQLLLCGNTRMSAADLLGCFRMPDGYLRELILDESPETGIGEVNIW